MTGSSPRRDDSPREVPAGFAHYRDCFACGPENPASMGLRFTIDGGRVRSAVTFDELHQGAPGYAHGGAVATAIDDTLGTLLVMTEYPAVTAKLEVNYRRPALVGHPMEVEAWVEREEGRKLHLAAELRSRADGEVIADSRALFLRVSLEHFHKHGETLPEAWKRTWRGREPKLPY